MSTDKKDILYRLADMSQWFVHNTTEQIRNDLALEAITEISKLRNQVTELEKELEKNSKANGN